MGDDKGSSDHPPRPSLRITLRRRRPREDEEAASGIKKPEKKKMKKQTKNFRLSGGVQFQLDIKYAPRDVLGNGSFGVVCSGVNRETDEKVAIKKIATAFEDESMALQTLREMQILRRIGTHDNVISLKDVMLSSGPAPVSPTLPLKSSFRHVYLVHELMDFDLSRVITSLSGGHIRSIMFQILRGLKFLHSANIIHRDLKPQNILLNKNTDVKICDLGLARTKRLDPQKMTECIGTRLYSAPEMLMGIVWYGPAIDVWSAGCVLAEMLTGRPLFSGENNLEQIRKMFDVLGTPSDIGFIQSFNFRKYVEGLPPSRGDEFDKMFESAEPSVVDLMKKMLAVNPWERISASKALEHPYFSGLYDPSCDDSSPTKVNLDVDQIGFAVDMSTIRDLVWEEMLFYRPDERT